jgi:hypothetical protein
MVGAVGGGALALGAGYVWLAWYFTRNNPL